MLQPNAPLKVMVNPYAAVDEHGRPCGAVLLDPTDIEKGGHRNYARDNPKDGKWEPREFVGASRKARRLSTKPPRTIRLKDRKGRQHIHTFRVRHDYTWEFSKVAVEVPNTQWYQRLLKTGELLAADVTTWTLAGGDKTLFVEPAQRLAWAKEGAIHHLVAAHYPEALAAHRAAGAEGKPSTLAKDVPEDYRITNLALHWDGHVKQTHPVGIAIAAKSAAAKADAAKAAEAETAKAAEALADKADKVTPAPATSRGGGSQQQTTTSSSPKGG